MSQDTTQVHHRLSPSVYAALEKQVPKPSSTSNPIEAGYLLGIQFVLRLLREGYMDA